MNEPPLIVIRYAAPDLTPDDIPDELFGVIAGFLRLSAYLALRATCKRFYTLLAFPSFLFNGSVLASELDITPEKCRGVQYRPSVCDLDYSVVEYLRSFLSHRRVVATRTVINAFNSRDTVQHVMRRTENSYCPEARRTRQYTTDKVIVKVLVQGTEDGNDWRGYVQASESVSRCSACPDQPANKYINYPKLCIL
jgi:hypothetical protein